MSLLMNQSPITLWQDLIKNAENRCTIKLNHEVEDYLVALMMRYMNKPDLSHRLFALSFLKAVKKPQNKYALQAVGDECLIYAGLFPKAAERKLIKINYFVDLGRAAYGQISQTTNDIFASLAMQFVVLMDVLQSIRGTALLPHEALEQWEQVGSRRALNLLHEYAKLGIIPIKKLS